MCPSYGSHKGFTLIELLIVVTIIGILAAIAIPLATIYRQQAANAAALSDIKNLHRSQVGMLSAGQSYGLTTNVGAPVALLGVGTILQGPGGPNDGLAGLQSFIPIGLSQNVEIVANTDVAGNTLTMLAKQEKGTRVFGLDSDDSLTHFLTSLPNLTLTASGINVAPVQSNLDFPAGAGWSQL